MIAFLAFLVFPEKSFAATYNVDIQPVSRSVDPGSSTSYTIDINSSGNDTRWKNTVSLSISGLPAGVSYSFSPNPVTMFFNCFCGYAGGCYCYSSGSSTLMVNVPAGTPSGKYKFTVTVSGGGVSRSTKAELAVNFVAIPEINLSASPAEVKQGQKTKLKWTTERASTCNASSTQNIWSGNKATSGNDEIIIADAALDTYIFTLSCQGVGGSNSASVPVGISRPEYKGVFIGENVIINTNRDYVLRIKYDSRIISIIPPGFAQIFAPLWKEIAP